MVKNRIPNGWSTVMPIGHPLPGTQFIAFKENARYIGAGLNQTNCLEESCPADMQTQGHEDQPMDMQNHGHGLTMIKLPEGLSSGILA